MRWEKWRNCAVFDWGACKALFREFAKGAAADVSAVGTDAAAAAVPQEALEFNLVKILHDAGIAALKANSLFVTVRIAKGARASDASGWVESKQLQGDP